MRVLLDTHILLWAAYHPHRLPEAIADYLASATAEPLFSVASLWEVSTKFGLGRPDFLIHPRDFRDGLLQSGYQELAITGEHALLVGTLPLIHRDPFDRMLITQATAERVDFFTSDGKLAEYGGVVRYFA